MAVYDRTSELNIHPYNSNSSSRLLAQRAVTTNGDVVDHNDDDCEEGSEVLFDRSLLPHQHPADVLDQALPRARGLPEREGGKLHRVRLSAHRPRVLPVHHAS